MCPEVVGRDRDASSSYLVRELLPLQAADLCTNSSQLMKQKQGDLNLARKSCWFGLGFQKTKTAPRIVSASVGASEIGSTNADDASNVYLLIRVIRPQINDVIQASFNEANNNIQFRPASKVVVGSLSRKVYDTEDKVLSSDSTRLVMFVHCAVSSCHVKMGEATSGGAR
uniref:Uncharacterized protein n=1 Tax=Brassica oleracea var. oleracea TaxID=109376 RepID=A0A0D3D7S2_BRAOL